jgi:hypothetical protein
MLLIKPPAPNTGYQPIVLIFQSIQNGAKMVNNIKFLIASLLILIASIYANGRDTIISITVIIAANSIVLNNIGQYVEKQ